MDCNSQTKSQDKFEAVLHEATREQLCEVIRNKAEWDEGFRAEVLMSLSAPDLKEALDATKARVRIAIRRNTVHGFIGWRGCDAICVEMTDCLDTAKSRYLDRYPAIAFELSIHLLIAGVKFASTADSSSGSLAEVTSQAMDLLRDVCKRLVLSQDFGLQKSCYEKLCKESLNKALDGWDDWSYGLLETAALLVTRQNFKRLDAALVGLRNREAQRTYPSSYAQHAEAKVRLLVTQTLEGEVAARAFIDEHLDMDEMRLLAVQKDMESGAYQNAERLCLEKTNTDKRPYGGEDVWRHLLFDIYAATGEKCKQIDVADALVCRGELCYYEHMKALYGEEWSGAYPTIRARYQTSLPRYAYMHILNAECEWALLLQEVRQQPEAIFQYSKALAAFASQETYDLYRSEILRAAGSATERRAYQRICVSIRELNAVGGVLEALALIDELSGEYKRRPAMLDELSVLRRKLGK